MEFHIILKWPEKDSTPIQMTCLWPIMQVAPPDYPQEHYGL